MKILFTGASSFTGMWFVRELAAAGHDLVATFQGNNQESYDGIRRQRVMKLATCAQTVFGCSFGDERFMNVLCEDGPWDIVCHHAADVTNYKSADFNKTMMCVFCPLANPFLLIKLAWFILSKTIFIICKGRCAFIERRHKIQFIYNKGLLF